MRSVTRTPSGAQQLVDREEVLLGERLRRRHERPLAPALDRAEERVQRDDGLPRSDVALQEPLHGDGRSRSASISAIARSWSGVSVNGSDVR